MMKARTTETVRLELTNDEYTMLRVACRDEIARLMHTTAKKTQPRQQMIKWLAGALGELVSKEGVFK